MSAIIGRRSALLQYVSSFVITSPSVKPTEGCAVQPDNDKLVLDLAALVFAILEQSETSIATLPLVPVLRVGFAFICAEIEEEAGLGTVASIHRCDEFVGGWCDETASQSQVLNEGAQSIANNTMVRHTGCEDDEGGGVSTF